MELKTKLANLVLSAPIMNAAGTCKTLEDVKKLSRSASGAVLVGSITADSRKGNTGSIYYAGPMFSLNSFGLPNQGKVYYEKILPQMAAIAHEAGKPLFVSIAGFSPAEYAEMTELSFKGEADMVELNLGCPNVWQGKAQKRIVCFDPELVGSVLDHVKRNMGDDVTLAVKISPFSDPFALADVVKVIGGFKMVKAVTTVNTFPNAFSYHKKEPNITPGGGLAGFAGPAIKSIGLGQVRQLRALLPKRIQIMGVGGISHEQDVWEYLNSGAIATQIATAYIEKGEKIFGKIAKSLAKIA